LLPAPPPLPFILGTVEIRTRKSFKFSHFSQAQTKLTCTQTLRRPTYTPLFALSSSPLLSRFRSLFSVRDAACQQPQKAQKVARMQKRSAEVSQKSGASSKRVFSCAFPSFRFFFCHLLPLFYPCPWCYRRQFHAELSTARSNRMLSLQLQLRPQQTHHLTCSMAVLLLPASSFSVYVAIVF